ncbi:MAG: hypothetical protein GTO41_03705 [Burkholderiales bacterium]|nr:hypothetical protein [Burkholderiales bacterium]
MSLITTLRLREQSWAPIVLGMLLLGLISLVLQPCVMAATVAPDTSSASTVQGEHYADPAQQAAGEPYIPCSRCGAHPDSQCAGAPSEDCGTEDRLPANAPVKPKNDRSTDLAVLPRAVHIETNSFSRLPTTYKPVSALPSSPGPSLNIRYCVYLI